VVEETLDMVGLLDRAGGFIGNLSKGMRQRVGLAQALLHRPPVLILDEPTIGLDPAQIIEVRNLIREIGKERTVLLSTHILSEAQQICDRILIINKGKIVAEDTPENLQSSLSGVRRIALTLGNGQADIAAKKLEGLSGVQDVILKNENSLELQYGVEEDIRPNVARAVIKANLDLLEMRADSLSLEDIFLQLTKDDSAESED
jgi:ABC-2 type transport system ATP-binding protein